MNADNAVAVAKMAPAGTFFTEEPFPRSPLCSASIAETAGFEWVHHMVRGTSVKSTQFVPTVGQPDMLWDGARCKKATVPVFSLAPRRDSNR